MIGWKTKDSLKKREKKITTSFGIEYIYIYVPISLKLITILNH